MDRGEIAARPAKEIVGLKSRRQIEIVSERDEKKRRTKVREAKQEAKRIHKEDQGRTALVLTKPQKGKLDYYTVESVKEGWHLNLRLHPRYLSLGSHNQKFSNFF